MKSRGLAMIGVLIVVCMLFASRESTAVENANAYLSVEFYAGINDTMRDTTLSGGSVEPGSPILAMTSSSGCSGGKSMTFALFTTASSGSAAWAETLACVPIDIATGYVTVLLGQTHPISTLLLHSPSLYLEVTIDKDVLTPRIAILSMWRSAFLTETSTRAGIAASDPQSSDPAPKVYGLTYESPAAVATSANKLRPKAIVLADAVSSPMARVKEDAHAAALAWKLHESEKSIAALRNELKLLKPKVPKSK